MNSLEALQAKNGLWHQLWIVAIDEAYTAKDAARRMSEMLGLAESDIVAVYFTYHPEMKRWAEDHIRNETCDVAIAELQTALRDTRARRTAAMSPQREAPKASAKESAVRPGVATKHDDPDVPRVIPPASADPEKEVKPTLDQAKLAPFDAYEARGMMIGLKKTSTSRPTRDEVRYILEGRFSDVSRDKAEKILFNVWGEGKTGPRNPRNSRNPRNPRNSTPETRAKATSKVENPRNTPRN